MVRREGTIEALATYVAGKRRVQITVARLRLDGQRSQIDAFVEGMREASRR